VTTAATGCREADIVAGDRKLMMASLFILSRRPEVPTFAYQLCAFDAAFEDNDDAKATLDRLVKMGILIKSYANFGIMMKMPMATRGDTECYRPLDNGVRILRAAYRSYRR